MLGESVPAVMAGFVFVRSHGIPLLCCLNLMASVGPADCVRWYPLVLMVSVAPAALMRWSFDLSPISGGWPCCCLFDNLSSQFVIDLILVIAR
jgi:hypothetical protein